MTDTCPDFDIDDLCDDIRYSMASDDRQTRAEYQRGCAALANLRARILELESTRQLAPHVNAGEVAGAWFACSEQMPEDKSRVWFFKGSVRRGYYCSEGFFSETGMGWAPSEVSHWMPCPGEPAPPVTGAEPALNDGRSPEHREPNSSIAATLPPVVIPT